MHKRSPSVPVKRRKSAKPAIAARHGALLDSLRRVKVVEARSRVDGLTLLCVARLEVVGRGGGGISGKPGRKPFPSRGRRRRVLEVLEELQVSLLLDRYKAACARKHGLFSTGCRRSKPPSAPHSTHLASTVRAPPARSARLSRSQSSSRHGGLVVLCRTTPKNASDAVDRPSVLATKRVQMFAAPRSAGSRRARRQRRTRFTLLGRMLPYPN